MGRPAAAPPFARHVLLVCAACSGSPDGQPKVDPGLRQPIHGAHGGTIEIVAVTEDGRAVLSQDRFNRTRLWPRLDGGAEPIVLQMPAARELLLGRDGDGFLVATLDPADAVTLLRTAATGEVRGRVQLSSDPAIDHIEMHPRGVLAIRVDQKLELFEASGVSRGTLAAAAGERIENVIVRAGRALALISSSSGVYGRFVDLDGDPRWGSTTAMLAIDPTRAVLSPDHEHIAAIHDRKYVVLVELATGKVGPIVCFSPISREPHLRADVTPLGFADATTIGCRVDGHLEWAHSQDGTSYQIKPDDAFQIDTHAAAVGDGIAVAASATSLALRTHKGLQYLGYGFGSQGNGLASLIHSRNGPGGMLLGMHTGDPLLLDEQRPDRRTCMWLGVRTEYRPVRSDDRQRIDVR